MNTGKAPIHLWIVGIISLLWNAVGAFDYTATQMKLDFYMSQFTPEQLDYFYGFPAWVDAGWALGVWGALLGSLTLLLRKAFAVWLFGVSILGMVATSLYTFVLTDATGVAQEGALTFSIVIWVIALFLFFYAKAMAARRVLN
jgi:hypothetical protein